MPESSGVSKSATAGKGEKDAENSKKNQMIQDHIKKTLTAKVEDLIEVFRKEYTNQRPYCNKVMVKVRKTELL